MMYYSKFQVINNLVRKQKTTPSSKLWGEEGKQIV